jgi:5-methyltetrahydropteroyltriglutamate--homocysteine methyltransferase
MAARQWDGLLGATLFHSFGDVLNGDEHPVALKDVITMAPPPVTATILGAPRIGPNRELKRATEKYWAGNIPRAELESVAADLRRASCAALASGGLDSMPVNTFSYYDQVLDTAVMVGALPPRVAAIEDDLDRYFAAARGTATIAPLEMTKWFDTNYHYIVPEIGPDTTFSLHTEKVLNELKEAQDQGVPARPVLVRSRSLR